MDLYSTSKNCVGHYTPIALLVDSIWKKNNDYKGTKSYVLSSFLKPILNVFITVANMTILKMVIYVGYMPLNQLYLKTPWNNPMAPLGPATHRLGTTGLRHCQVFCSFSYSDIIILEGITHKGIFSTFNGMLKCIYWVQKFHKSLRV